MQVTIDGTEGFEFASPPDTVAQALAAIVDALEERGRGLQSIAVDGSDIPPGDLAASLGDRAVEVTKRLDVQSAEITALLEDSLREMADVLPELAIACHSLAQVVQSEAPQEGIGPFEQLISIWQAIKSRQRLVATNMKLQIEEISVDGKSLPEREKELESLLGRAVAAIEQSDFATLADMLSYELAPRAEVEEKINDYFFTCLED